MLGWSINLFRIFGIQLAVHASFFLLLAYYAYDGWTNHGVLGMVWSVGLILLFFVCVVLHELGHSLTAQRYGVRVPRILLLPIGGMAEFDRIPRQPSEELWITLAGPAVNFLLAAALTPVMWSSIVSDRADPPYSLADLGGQLWLANLAMGIFNLLPVFPMDGGRIFRALLAMKLPYLRATWWAASVGKVLAFAGALTMAFYLRNYLGAALFAFIFVAGDAEYKQLLRREQEAQYWAGMAKRIVESAPAGSQPPPPTFLSGPG
ncbi:MAG: site-2 protease family protein [Opitutae bacterium]|nr:site-2 protease family protein [Opitutae bacterium]